MNNIDCLEKNDKEIYDCNVCETFVEKFPVGKTVSYGNNNDILLLGEAPANNGWRKSGKAWHDINNKLLPSGVILQKLLNIINIKIDDVYFLEVIKCFPKDRKFLLRCSNNCKYFLIKQLDIIKPKIVLALGDYATKSVLDIKYIRFSDVAGKCFNVNGYIIIPIYHPSPISPLSYKGNVPIFNMLKDIIKCKE